MSITRCGTAEFRGQNRVGLRSRWYFGHFPINGHSGPRQKLRRLDFQARNVFEINSGSFPCNPGDPNITGRTACAPHYNQNRFGGNLGGLSLHICLRQSCGIPASARWRYCHSSADRGPSECRLQPDSADNYRGHGRSGPSGSTRSAFDPRSSSRTSYWERKLRTE